MMLEQIAFECWVSFLSSMPTLSGNLNLSSRFRTFEGTTTDSSILHDMCWGDDPGSRTWRDRSYVRDYSVNNFERKSKLYMSNKPP